jgi:hypothetical protein
MARLIDTEDTARDMFETFKAKGSRKQHRFPFTWPSKMQEVGQAIAQLYRSNKWQSNPKHHEDYKHIAEAPQFCYVTPGFLRNADDNSPLKVYGKKVDLPEEMPKHFAILAALIGVQIRLYGPDGRLQRGDAGLYEISVAQGMLGGARFPDNDEAFLFVYTKKGGVHMIITGKELEIEKDGITG